MVHITANPSYKCEINTFPYQLHAHLTGSISRECLHDIWVKKKENDPTLTLEDPLIAIPTGKVDYDIVT